MQLHKPEQPSITYLTLALTFSMRLKSILKLHQFQQESGVLYLQLLCLRIPFCPPSLREKGFSEVADWLRVQESLKWALVLGWFCRVFGLVAVGKRNLAHELNGKKIN